MTAWAGLVTREWASPTRYPFGRSCAHCGPSDRPGASIPTGAKVPKRTQYLVLVKNEKFDRAVSRLAITARALSL
jgi:hypothetical protein